MSWDSLAEAESRLRSRNCAAWGEYFGFYSSWLGGYFREPRAMAVPLDDHGFHRGDGVFEAVRIHRRAYIDFDAHVKRLGRSAALIGLRVPGDVAEICLELARRCDQDEGLLRLYVTRGPGSFSPNPRESVGAQVYATITRLKPPSPAKYANGCSATVSSVVAKDPFFARIKSLNYLQNVLIKAECVDRGADLAVCLTLDGVVCEGATENIMIVTNDHAVRVPRFDYTLPGTTVSTVMDIARELPAVAKVEFADLTRDDLASAREIAFVGTTLGVLGVNTLDARAVGVGAVCTELQRRLVTRMDSDRALRTEF